MLLGLGRKIGGSLSKMKLETYVWLENEYEIAKPYNLEKTRKIRTRPSLVQVRQINISNLGAGHKQL